MTFSQKNQAVLKIVSDRLEQEQELILDSKKLAEELSEKSSESAENQQIINCLICRMQKQMSNELVARRYMRKGIY